MRLIDVEALKNKVIEQISSLKTRLLLDKDFITEIKIVWFIKLLKIIENVPTIEAKPVVHAHWESTIYTVEKAPGEISKIVGYRCGNCGRIIEEFENYCPSCGAEMYEKRECLSSV